MWDQSVVKEEANQSNLLFSEEEWQRPNKTDQIVFQKNWVSGRKSVVGRAITLVQEVFMEAAVKLCDQMWQLGISLLSFDAQRVCRKTRFIE